MRNFKPYLILVCYFILCSCSEKKDVVNEVVKNEPLLALPFQPFALNDMTEFGLAAKNWRTVGSVYANRKNKEILEFTEGTGILVNVPDQDNKDHLLSTFEHGDIELELDVMIPKGSNSGIYFQSRYELQLFDSWGVKEPKHGDMGGVYQRWNELIENSTAGFDGHAPKVNAAKAPGLWQHLKITFHAPKFDQSGNKIKNAWFEEVWLNGVLLHNNIELTGPTRAALYQNEQALGKLMIQGDHGPVALKNIEYKLYSNKAIGFKNLKVHEYDNTAKKFPDLSSLKVVTETSTNAIDLNTASNSNSQKIFKYTGSMIIPDSGDYLFDISLNGGAALLLKTDTVISMNGSYYRDSLGLGKVFMEKGEIPFTLIYNKHTPWERGFDIYVEGPGMQKYSLQKIIPSTDQKEIQKDYSINVDQEIITQRSFWMHEGMKRTHCISVGMSEGINYTYDLETGSLLQLWGGDFMDATKMWRSRGEKQLGEPEGFIVSLHGDPEFASLKNDTQSWPDSSIENSMFKQKGYEFDNQGFPVFKYQVNGSTITNKMIPSETERFIKRVISVEGPNEIWYKLADGEQIKKLPDGSYIVNDESYYIDFSSGTGLIPIIRNTNGIDELIVKVPSGKQNINYNIIW